MRILNPANIVNLLEVTDSEETLLIIMEYLNRGDYFSDWRPNPDFEARDPTGPNHHGCGSHQGH